MADQTRLARARQRLQSLGQEHLLHFAPQLGPAALRTLLDQLESLPLEDLPAMLAQTQSQAAVEPDDLEPVALESRDGANAAAYRAEGERLIREGRVAAFTVAGGQGTRLGWRGPKGTYPATVVTGKPLFRVFAEQLLATERRFGCRLPWYVMTSPLNDADTRAFFKDNNWFGRNPQDHLFVPQGLVPCVDEQGKAMLSTTGEVATNPDGHGGAIRALDRGGALQDMARRGIEQISYFQVDNPLVRCVDPVFLGAHVLSDRSSGQMSSKCVPKRNAAEKVGVLCQVSTPEGPRTMVVEYSDLPKAMAEKRDAHGELAFNAANIAVHVISVAFAGQLARGDGIRLPWHRAVKKVPHLDIASGQAVDPSRPNAVKFECFIFDALALAERSLSMQVSRVEEFAPIKNAEGEDSPASSHRIQSDRHGAWLEAHGTHVPRRGDGSVDARIEIGPLAAMESADLRGRPLPKAVQRGQELVI
jgi:UDP-N-acetylglucosamine/UDP-N-acetylgalactosamine diphosphorylase